MRKNNILSILSLALIVLGFSSCYEQEVVDPISPADYPTATITPNFSGDVVEGDTITYTVTLDKMVDFDLPFTFQLDELSEITDHDVEITDAVVAAYSTEATISVIILDDGAPNFDKKLVGEVGCLDIGFRYALNEATENIMVDMTIKNNYDTSAVVVAFGWDNPANDIDLFGIYDNAGTNVDWALAGTANNPEVMATISVDHPEYGPDPDGDYFITIDPYYMEGTSFNWYALVGYPDGAVEEFTGVFDLNLIDTYTVDYFAYWDVNTYRVLVLNRAGNSYSATQAMN